MKSKLTLMAGVATAALSGAMMMTSALAANYDDQVEETRALNLQALADARSQNGSTMPMPMPMPTANSGDADEADGMGGPSFDGPPGPDDMGTDTGDWDDEADEPADALPPDDVE